MVRKVISILLIFVAIASICLCGCIQTAENTQQQASRGSPGVIDSESTPVTSKTYIVGIDGEYPPYSFIDKNGTARGFDVESIQWMGKEFGFKVEIQAIPWSEIIQALQTKRIDMIYSGMTITDKRRELVNFSNPYWKVNQSVAINNNSSLTFEDFKVGKGRVGAQQGSTGAFWVEENLVNKSLMTPDHLVLYDSFPQVMTDLQNTRIDFAIFDRPPMVEAISGKPVHLIGEIDTGEVYGVAIRKDDTELLSTINKGLDMLMRSPKWDDLKTKYRVE